MAVRRLPVTVALIGSVTAIGRRSVGQKKMILVQECSRSRHMSAARIACAGNVSPNKKTNTMSV